MFSLSGVFMVQKKKTIQGSKAEKPAFPKISDDINFKERFDKIIKAIKNGENKLDKVVFESEDNSIITLKINNRYIKQEVVLPIDEQFAFFVLSDTTKNEDHFFIYFLESDFFNALSKVLTYNYLNSKKPLTQSQHAKYVREIAKLISAYTLFFREINQILEEQKEVMQSNGEKHDNLDFYKKFFNSLEKGDMTLNKLKKFKQTHDNLRKISKKSIINSFLSVIEFTENIFGLLDNSFDLNALLNTIKVRKELLELEKEVRVIFNYIAKEHPEFLERLKKS